MQSGSERELTQLREELALWVSPRMRTVHRIVCEAALINVTILITGETGTGKELVARAVHGLGERRHGPFVKVGCAAVAHQLLESELFGHEPGAFLDRPELKIGKFQEANRGTIFLDEIGDLHPSLQAKLLHVLEDGQLARAGGWSTAKADLRVVVATNQDLEASVAAGRFRQDLFYRLNVIRIDVPPLRHRLEDVPGLAQHFVRRYCTHYQRKQITLSPETMQRLARHSFPGNVRELENMVKRMILLRDLELAPVTATKGTGRALDPRPQKRTRTPLSAISRKAAQAAEHRAIRAALEVTRWNRRRAATLLNISYRSLLYKIKLAGLTDINQRAPDLS
jgi:transcriptional regulator with PAS, ATPase and Fis domain